MELKKNIDSTIGCEYELVAINNSNNSYSIAEAYNEGVRRAKGDILCFMHEDILFHTLDWGKNVISLLEDSKVGLLGVIGSQYKSKRCQPWWADFACVGQVIQGRDIDGLYKTEKSLHWERKSGDSSLAAIIDGLWMCAKKSVFENIQFDSDNYDGFHMYDHDICMQIHKKGLDVRVMYNVLIEHKSPGYPDSKFQEQLEVWFRKWQDYLPIFCGEIMEGDILIPEQLCSVWADQKCRIEKQYYSVVNSMAYRLGKFILHPSMPNIKRMMKFRVRLFQK